MPDWRAGTFAPAAPANDAPHLALERSQREGFDHENRTARGLGQRLRAHEYELAAQFRLQRERLLPEPQATASRHVHVGDDHVELVAADCLQPFEATGRGPV